MKFRRIYWVTEQVADDGQSQVAGVYTSIPDLLERGLVWKDGIEGRAGFRISLVKLDSHKSPLGIWSSPSFDGLEDALKEYVGTGEFSEGDCEQMSLSVREFCKA